MGIIGRDGVAKHRRRGVVVQLQAVAAAAADRACVGVDEDAATGARGDIGGVLPAVATAASCHHEEPAVAVVAAVGDTAVPVDGSVVP